MPLFLSCPYDSCTCKPDLFFNGSQWCGCLLSVLHSCFRLKPLSQLTIRSYFHGVVVDTRPELGFCPTRLFRFSLPVACMCLPAALIEGWWCITVATFESLSSLCIFLSMLLIPVTNSIPFICTICSMLLLITFPEYVY